MHRKHCLRAVVGMPRTTTACKYVTGTQDIEHSPSPGTLGSSSVLVWATRECNLDLIPARVEISNVCTEEGREGHPMGIIAIPELVMLFSAAPSHEAAALEAAQQRP